MKKPDPVEAPTKEYQTALYNVYKTVFAQNVLRDEGQCVKIMTYLFAYQPWSWRVVGITEDAVKKIKRNNLQSKGLHRDHFIQGRTETYRQMFHNRSKPLRQAEWWELFWTNDRTIIMTQEEHKQKNDDKIKCYKSNWEEGYFPCNKLVGFRFRKTIEGELISSKEFLSESNKYSISQMKKSSAL